MSDKRLTWKEIDALPPGFERLRTTCCEVAFEILNAAEPWLTCTRCGERMEEYRTEIKDYPRDPLEITLANWMIRFPLDPFWRGGELTGMALAAIRPPIVPAVLADGTPKPQGAAFGTRLPPAPKVKKGKR